MFTPLYIGTLRHEERTATVGIETWEWHEERTATVGIETWECLCLWG